MNTVISNWVEHPTKPYCFYNKIIASDNIIYHLTICDTYVNVDSTSFKAEFDALNLEDAKNKAIKLVKTFISMEAKTK